MALAISSHTNTRERDPTIFLKQVLASFEDTLTDEQKRQYQASTSKPDAASVIAFVADLDAGNSNKSMARRCVAPRLHTFLESTQQFSHVVDTFVSSNPSIAALVWGGVKTAILTASNIASYFEKVTSMIMAIGRSCPVYQEFGQLYQGCVGLQRALCDYYAIIIQLCIKIINVSRRTPLTQTLSSMLIPFESEFKPLLDKLDQATEDMQLQMSLASKQADEKAKKLLEHEIQSNATFRQFAIKLGKETRKEQADARQLRIDKKKREAAELKSNIKNNLSIINHAKPWKQAIQQRVPTTAEWLLQESLFRQWNDSRDTAILWCPGTMGMGKTVLMSNVVSQLHASRKSNDIISYYFCRGDNAASLSARTILGSLARQVLDSQIERAENDSLQDLYEDSQDLTAAEVVDFLLSHLEADKKYYIVLDGLDECDSGEVQQVAWSVARIREKCVKNLKILCAGRPELEKQLFRGSRPNYKISVTEKQVESDMDHYIATILGRCLEEEQLELGDPKLIVEISKALRDGSHGMFLWTRLFIEELCAQGSDNDILKALEHPPRGLSEIFDRKIRRVWNRMSAEKAIKILQFCGATKRPLTVMEYQEASSLSLGQKSIDRGKFPNDMGRIIGDCCGLVFVDEEDNTVHYVHHSVKQHLYTIHGPHTAEFDMARIDLHLGFLCMTYLDFTDFKGQLTKVNQDFDTPIKPLQLGIFPIHTSSSITSRVALKLLSHGSQLQHLSTRELERKTQEVLDDRESSDLHFELQKQNFPFLNYAWTYWIDHVRVFNADTENTMWKLFCRCVKGDGIIAYKPWSLYQRTYGKINDKPKSLDWVLVHGHYTLLLYHARYEAGSLDDYSKREILCNAPIQDRYHFTELIIQQSNNSSEILNHGLFYASRDGCIDSVASSLQAGADINAQVGSRTALQAAARGGHLEVVERLLMAKADVNTPVNHGGKTALQEAAGRGHIQIVERLLTAKADVDGHDFYSQNALHTAARGGHLEVVERLLAAEAFVNLIDCWGYTAIQAAAKEGYMEIVQRLRDAGAVSQY